MQEWQQQFDRLESVDLRYDRQIIVNPDLQGTVKQPPLSAERQKGDGGRSKACGADYSHQHRAQAGSQLSPVKPVGPSIAKPTPSKPAANVKTAKAAHHRGHIRPAKASAKAKSKN